MSLDAMKQALEALEEIADEVFSPYDNKLGDAITALRAAIEQAEKPWVKTYTGGKPHYTTPEEQEPVAWRWKELVNGEVFDSWVVTSCEPPPYAVETQPLYTAPRQWQGLTYDEIESITADNDYWDHHTSTDFARAVETLLKAKNS